MKCAANEVHCANPPPPLFRRCLVKRVLAHDYRHAPCNNPYLEEYIRTHPENVTVEIVNSTIVVIDPSHPTVGQLRALKFASKFYAFADLLYLVDAWLIMWGWVRYDRERRRGGGDTEAMLDGVARATSRQRASPMRRASSAYGTFNEK